MLYEDRVDALVSPKGALEMLSQEEIARMSEDSGDLHELFRRCALAILNCGSDSDDPAEVMSIFKDFEVRIIQQERGVKLELTNAPSSAFVDGKMISSVREMLFSVLRDIIFTYHEYNVARGLNDASSDKITNVVFELLRNANVFRRIQDPDMVVCWGGHSIARHEYDYTKYVGHELGLRELNICTGCGPGAMKGPMKGAAIAHAKQRIKNGIYLGLTEPGIIAAESPNPIVNQLVIMPDIEKRLEAFVRTGHGIVVFPGGAGTAEEILYILGILLHPKNEGIPFPLVLTGPKESAAYFEQINEFIGAVLGEKAQSLYQIVIDDGVEVARIMKAGMEEVRLYRKAHQDAFYYNWKLHIPDEFQRTFEPDHENVAGLNLFFGQETHLLAADLRRAFSAIVAGNVKPQGVASIKEHGPFEIHGDKRLMKKLDALLEAFVKQQRMKLPGTAYVPCYKVITD
ncbi:LOG family protein YgdH [Marinomonas gallaica]|uniref:AMP nucleosidase n=1 Tax=Marinomonas gallaica TaxID=1806667 RepID=A0A1C3JPR7_9GAMM|nr:nucleotide 5'-monophosphate nucleosidase PpnN [Marinomonas gallaica]SBT17152.1 LOG family protein YgdH [Marinomonas gallaica]SBT19487.1 LOG family protein YgdH [Marinomonas gallaica]